MYRTDTIVNWFIEQSFSHDNPMSRAELDGMCYLAEETYQYLIGKGKEPLFAERFAVTDEGLSCLVSMDFCPMCILVKRSQSILCCQRSSLRRFSMHLMLSSMS